MTNKRVDNIPRYTTQRNGVYYVNFRLPNGAFFRQSLGTDSLKQCQTVMSNLSTYIPLVQSGAMSVDTFRDHISGLRAATQQDLREYFFRVSNAYVKTADDLHRTGGRTGELGLGSTPKSSAMLADVGALAARATLYMGNDVTTNQIVRDLRKEGISVDAQSPDVLQIAQDLDMLRAQVYQTQHAYFSGDLFGYQNRLREIQSQVVQPPVDEPITNPTPPAPTIREAWEAYVVEYGKSWTSAISAANHRYMDVWLHILGADKPVTTVTKNDVRSAMACIEELPRRSLAPYNKMSVPDLLALSDIPEEHLIGASAIEKYLKTFRSLFRKYLYRDSDILPVDITLGIPSPECSSHFGAYSLTEMRQIISHARTLDTPLKWVILLLSYTGARRTEIASLTAAQVKLDADSDRYYLLISPDSGGKTAAATRQVPLHQHLLDWGFLDFVAACQGGALFPEYSSYPFEITKQFSLVRDRLGIPYLDDYSNRRIVHSLRHTFIRHASGWASNMTHVQQVVGHEKTGIGVTQIYLGAVALSLSVVCYVVDNLDYS
ncbi:site-specific tyrosine recombinase XerD [Serratia quinivorans]|nr:site-specific tyrosine recombinase XerD [Serratia quinivorans]